MLQTYIHTYITYILYIHLLIALSANILQLQHACNMYNVCTHCTCTFTGWAKADKANSEAGQAYCSTLHGLFIIILNVHVVEKLVDLQKSATTTTFSLPTDSEAFQVKFDLLQEQIQHFSILDELLAGKQMHLLLISIHVY